MNKEVAPATSFCLKKYVKRRILEDRDTTDGTLYAMKVACVV